MTKLVNHSEPETRQELLRAALKNFAERGYAATSVQDIVDAARVSKPALYYYFRDKAGLYQALVERAHDERYAIMRSAAARGRTVGEKLEELVAAVFEFSLQNRELMRLAFATAFTAAGEAPCLAQCREKGRRNFDFLHSLITAGQRAGELARDFTADEITMGIYGQLNSYIIVRLLAPECPVTRQTAKQIVRLFLEGAAGGRRNGRRRATARAGRRRAARNGSPGQGSQT